MKLNAIKPAEGAKQPRKRVGRGIGSGLGKTCGRGHKGQHSRSGGYHKVGFEGGQMPLQRRLPKFGFRSRKAMRYAEVRLHELNGFSGDVVDMTSLKLAGLVPQQVQTIKVIASGRVERAITVKGLRVTAGAKTQIEAAGGRVED